MTLKTTLFAAGAALALMSAPALAQDMDSAATAPPEIGAPVEAGSSAFTDAQVDSFAEAMTDIQSLNEQYSARVAAEADESAKAALQQQMTAEMTAAVEGAGLTSEEYNQIAAAAQGDAELRARIGQSMQADAGTSADASAEAGAEVEVEAETPSDM